MNYWLSSGLIAAATFLGACTTSPSNQAQAPKQQTIPGKVLPIVPPEYRADAPDRYIVQRGDTLWGIAGEFLKNPERWTDVWHANPQIENPNNIYPGDVIAYKLVGGERKLQVAGSNNPIRGEFTGSSTADGRPIYNLAPSVRTEALSTPIPAVPKDIVYPFISKNLILEPGFALDHPYVVSQADGSFISLTGRQDIYAKHDDDDFEYELYDVFRETTPVNDPITNELLGVEALYVGQLRLTKEANEDGVATFTQVDSVNPLYPDDILIPSEEIELGGELNFFPKLAELDAEEAPVVIRPLSSTGHTTSSQFSTVLINVGTDDNISTGDVFSIVRAQVQSGVGRDGQSFRLPDYEVGLGMVYKTNEETSYGLIMNAYDVIYPGDRLVTP